MVQNQIDNITLIIQKIMEKRSFTEVQIEEFAPEGKWAWQIANDIARDMKTNQLRKLFSQIKRIELITKKKGDDDDFKEPSLYLLIPQLAYAKARGLIHAKFYDLVKTVIGNDENTKIKKVRDYHRFVQFMTSVVAYSKR